jgi:hypothetical protein
VLCIFYANQNMSNRIKKSHTRESVNMSDEAIIATWPHFAKTLIENKRKLQKINDDRRWIKEKASHDTKIPKIPTQSKGN